MVNVIYNDSIPDAPNNPSQDQPKMQTNTNSIRSLIEIDHVGFGNNQGGYHLTIHQPVVPVGGQTAWDPVHGSIARVAIEASQIAGVQQIFPLFYTPDTTGGTPNTQLFTLTGNGESSQLTGNSAASSDGWAWLGGILLQWGRVTNPGSSGTVTFKDRVVGAIPFPNNIFNIQLSFQRASTSNAIDFGIDNGTPPTKTSFKYFSNTTGSNFLYWLAIGN